MCHRVSQLLVFNPKVLISTLPIIDTGATVHCFGNTLDEDYPSNYDRENH